METAYWPEDQCREEHIAQRAGLDEEYRGRPNYSVSGS